VPTYVLDVEGDSLKLYTKHLAVIKPGATKNLRKTDSGG
jgi:hypothetical protein